MKLLNWLRETRDHWLIRLAVPAMIRSAQRTPFEAHLMVGVMSKIAEPLPPETLRQQTAIAEILECLNLE